MGGLSQGPPRERGWMEPWPLLDSPRDGTGKGPESRPPRHTKSGYRTTDAHRAQQRARVPRGKGRRAKRLVVYDLREEIKPGGGKGARDSERSSTRIVGRATALALPRVLAPSPLPGNGRAKPKPSSPDEAPANDVPLLSTREQLSPAHCRDGYELATTLRPEGHQTHFPPGFHLE